MRFGNIFGDNISRHHLVLACAGLIAAVSCAVSGDGLLAAEAASAPRPTTVNFRRDIQPLLAEHCFHCHGKDDGSRKGGLRLDQREAALVGGESATAAIVPGQPEHSELLARILSTDPSVVMPPPEEGKPVRPADIEKLRQWIADGAEYAGHWAFAAPVKAAVPAGPEHPIDAFVQDRLAQEGLTPSAPASADTICRRLHLDLIGLPPSPAALDAFAAQVAAKGLTTAAGELADQLLADRRYGEKWARHWLDVARYSDSNGFEKDLPRDQWAWRDWVINSLNADLPYDQFLIQQLAGDLLPNRTQDHLIATGFLRNSMLNEEGAIIPEEWRMEAMFDRMDAIGSGVLGLSLKCAQCHTHKFDPIAHTEYYGLFAFLNNTYESQSWVYTPDQLAAIQRARDGIAGIEQKLKQQHADWQQKLADWETAERARLAATEWTLVEATDTHSSSELNHPTPLPDKSILTLGHRTVAGDVHIFAQPVLEGITGLRLEILTHGDLPFGGPGRSFLGTWALSDLLVDVKQPGQENWERQKLINATADFEEPLAGMESIWDNNALDKDRRRIRGPARLLADGDHMTGWRADRGKGRRNTDSVAVVQFEQPLQFPAGTQLKIALVTNHGGDDNGPKNTQIGRFRVALTRTPGPVASKTPYAAVLALQTPAAERTAAQEQAVLHAWLQATPELKSFADEIEAQWAGFPDASTSVLHLAERLAADGRETRRLDRGVWSQGREPIAPHVPATLHPLPADAPPNRLAFAQWLVDRRSPLTARVAVNRAWQKIFGTGFVETVEDLGTRAPEPSHPELLDWLAVDLMDRGWSQKQLLRTIVTSATYLQSSDVTPHLIERDPRNRLLARGPRFRVEAEVIRDLALSAAGLLSDKFGGPSIFPPMPQSVLDFNYFKPTYWTPATDSSRYARALYVFRKRSMPDPTMIAFDAPTGDFACTRRPRSNSPLAALTTLNEAIFVEAAQAMALRVLREGGADDSSRANYAFRLCTSRWPSELERTKILELLAGRRTQLQRKELPANEIAFSSLTKASDLPSDATPNDIAAWAIVARVLLNLDETISKN